MRILSWISVLSLMCLFSAGQATADNRDKKSERPPFETFTWSPVRETNFFDPFMWEPRAGLQALELHGHLFVIAGRKPILDPFNPFASEVFGDVWVSNDDGSSWTELIADAEADGLWRRRAYFDAVLHKGEMCLLGGQNYLAEGSEFFNDVWCSPNGYDWQERTAAASWTGRAGLGAASFKGRLWVMAGSKNDDEDINGGDRIFFNDVWFSANGGRKWKQATADAAWPARAGGVVIAKGPYLYLLGGEVGFDDPSEYLNDVWRTHNGIDWELMTDNAPWSPRPGHKCSVVADYIVCTGGFGVPANPSDVWVSRNGADWEPVNFTPWNNFPGSPFSCLPPAPPALPGFVCDNVRYDFDMLTRPLEGAGNSRRSRTPSFEILTFGGDRETFFLPSEVNIFRVENDVWRFGPLE